MFLVGWGHIYLVPVLKENFVFVYMGTFTWLCNYYYFFSTYRNMNKDLSLTQLSCPPPTQSKMSPRPRKSSGFLEFQSQIMVTWERNWLGLSPKETLISLQMMRWIHLFQRWAFFIFLSFMIYCWKLRLYAPIRLEEFHLIMKN